jgi:heme/copper-type cytochrome/quinol oxidase subunit 2
MRFRLFRSRVRVMTFLVVLVTTLLTVAPFAFARDDGGEGWYGETNDKVITNTMFILIGFFPVVIVLFTLIQWRLDKRKHAKMDAAKRRAANADWRGGW